MLNITPQPSKEIDKICLSLKKSVGSINKVLKTLESRQLADCSDLVMQIDSAIGSLNSGRNKILEHYLDDCLAGKSKLENPDKFKSQLLKLYKLTK